MELEYLKQVLDTHLFAKIRQPRDSEGTFSVFESNCHLLLPCSLSTRRWRQSR